MGGEGDGHGGSEKIPRPHVDPIFIDLNRNGKIDAALRAYFDIIEPAPACFAEATCMNAIPTDFEDISRAHYGFALLR